MTFSRFLQELRRSAVLACVPVALCAQRPVQARITGIVFDSLSNKALTGAMVRIVKASDPSVGRSATSDLFGRFTYDSVPAGSWLATFLHPVLDSLRLEPGVVRIDIQEPGEVVVPLTLPSAHTLKLLNCRAPLPADMGVIVGEVRRASDDAPLARATVEVSWPEWVLQKGRMVTDQRVRTVTTDSSGRYVLCGAPSGGTLRGVAWSGADTSGAVEVLTTDAGYTMLDFSVAPVEHIAVKADSASDASTRVSVRRGHAVVSGTITTADRRPLANAVVRVIGIGSQARTTATGAYTIRDAGAGTQTVEARAIGYQPVRQMVRLGDGTTTTVDLRLPVQRVQLDTVRVAAGKSIPVAVREIERRWRTGVGIVIDAATIRDHSSLFVTDALRGIGGLTIRQVGGYGQTVMMRNSYGAECPATIVLDGSALPPSQSASITIDDVARREDIAAVEVYPRPNMVPAEFLSMTSGCGIIAIWTKRGTGGVMPVKPTTKKTP